jgi:FkbM family methyltransferase
MRQVPRPHDVPVSLKARMLTNLRVRSTFNRLRSVPVAGWLLSRMVERVVPRHERLWIRLSSGLAAGRIINVDPRFQVAYLRGDYEPWVQELLRRHLRAGDTYFDVGAHVGFFVLCAKSLVALEPDAQNFKHLQANVARNELQGVTALQTAAWSSTGHVRFGSPPATSGRSQGRVTESDASTGQGSAGEDSVAAIRLDDIPGRAPAVVKMDIEGAETEACKGAERLLAEQKTVWIVEAHGDAVADELTELFEHHGYQVSTDSPRHPVYGQYRETYIVAQPRAGQPV